MSELLIGYDVECVNEGKTKGINVDFLKKMKMIHEELNAPCTLFCRGQTIESNMEGFQEIRKNSLFDIQQHTYSHVLFKTILRKTENGVEYVRGGSLEQIYEEVEKTNRILKGYLDVDCIGITGPYTYYRGLQDRPDILEILHELGIRFMRTYGRNAEDSFPVSMDIHPFWYDIQGFSDVLEFPITGWKGEYFEGFTDYVKSNIDYIAGRNLSYSYLHHDFSYVLSPVKDPELHHIREIIIYAQKKGVEILSYKESYIRRLKEKEKKRCL